MQVNMTTYVHTLEYISPEQLEGFFEGWPNPPSKEMHFKLLQNSDQVVLAIDESSNQVVGFITAITDHVLSAYIPFVEVLTAYQGQGIGKKLVMLMLDRLKDMYMIDLLCDEEFQLFYENLGMSKAKGMMIRNYECPSGKQDSSTKHGG
jgi:ribosomal protein S18 acetylase RimI-like enzyme